MPPVPDETLDALLDDLNDPQREAVRHADGPLLVLAGPGSGKTRVITRRAARLAMTVTDPNHVLAVTFTNKAAREMGERIERLSCPRGITVSTFHALGARLLRRYADLVGLTPEFTIFDADDRKRLIRQAVALADRAVENWYAMAERQISLAKGALLDPTALGDALGDWRSDHISAIYAAYDHLLRTLNGVDFDDLLNLPIRILEQHEDVLATVQDRFRYVLVDEYQDTNGAQYRLARLLTAESRNLCVTGDPDQSIYSWRGADLGNILSFEQDFPDASVVRLEENYRSTAPIVSMADALIQQNVNRKDKTHWTRIAEGDPVRLLECENSGMEAETIADEIVRWTSSGGAAGEIAIFYRINAMSRLIEDALRSRGVAYQIARGLEFYGRKEIKDALAYMRVLVNPADDLSWNRIINRPARGIGDQTLSRMHAMAEAAGMRLADLVFGDAALSPLGRGARKVADFRETMRALQATLTLSASEACDRVISLSGLRAHYRGKSGEDTDPSANLDELVRAAQEFEDRAGGATLVDWLEETALVADIDQVAESGGLVTLMTLHASKGLEFSQVYILGLEDGMLPLRREDDDDVDLEEERRLLFVGMTRARRRLTLCRSLYRLIRNRENRTVESPFLADVPRAELNVVKLGTGPERRGGRRSRREGLPPDIEQWEHGTLVRHPEWGLGAVQRMSLVGGDYYVKILFKSGREETVALAYSQLQRVDYDEVA